MNEKHNYNMKQSDATRYIQVVRNTQKREKSEEKLLFNLLISSNIDFTFTYFFFLVISIS